MAGKISTGRSRGHIRRRGGSFQVLVYAGLDPLTGNEIRLTESAGTEVEAKAILRRLRAQVDEQRAPKTKASFRAAMGVPNSRARAPIRESGSVRRGCEGGGRRCLTRHHAHRQRRPEALAEV